MSGEGVRKGLEGLRAELGVFISFYQRALINELSFRSWFVMRTLGIVFGVASYSIFAVVVPSTEINSEIVARYGMTGKNPFLDFFLLGSIMLSLVTLGSTGIARLVNSPFYPYYHASPTGLATVLLGSTSFRYTWAMIETIAYMGVGMLFGMTLHLNTGVVLVLLTGGFLMFSMDLLSAGWSIITKTSHDPLNWFFNLFSQLVSGTWVPVWRLPLWLRYIAAIHPQRYINDMARSTMGGNMPVKEILPQLAVLLVVTTSICLVGYRCFQFGLHKARAEGTLGHAVSG